MFVKKVHIENYEGVKSFAAEFGEQAVLIGRNGSGKTTVLRAIAHTLTGEKRGESGKMEAAKTAIGPAATDAVVVVVLSDGENEQTVKMRITQAGARFTRNTETKTEEFFHITADQLSVACYPQHFIDGDNILAMLAHEQEEPLSDEQVKELFGDRTDEVIAWALKARIPFKATPAGLERIAQAAYDERRAVNRTIKENTFSLEGMGVRIRPRGPDGQPIADSHAKGINDKINALNADRDKVNVRLGQAAAQRSMKNELAELKSDPPEPPETPPSDALDKAKADLVEAQRQHDALSAKLNAMKGAGNCPTCGRPMEDVQYTDADRAAVLKEMEALRVYDKRAAYQRAEEAYNNALSEVDRWHDRRQRAEKIESLLAETVSTDELTAQLAELDARIAKGKALLKALGEASAYETLVAKLNKDTAAAELLTFIHKTLSDRGQIAKETDEVGQFVAAANTVLSLYGRELGVDAVDGQKATVVFRREGDEAWTPVSKCSQGERWLVQLAVATGFSPGVQVLMDRMESLDGAAKQITSQILADGAPALCAAAYQVAKDPDMTALANALAPVVPVWMGGVA